MKRILFILLLFIPLYLSGQVISSTVSYASDLYSPEMITDGTFDVGSAWGVNGGWSYDAVNDHMDFDDITNGNLTQVDGAMAFPIQINKTYKLEFDISIVGGGNANFCIKSTDGVTWVDYADYANGHHNFEINTGADIGAGGLYIRADENNCDAAFTIDNISIMEVF